MVRWGVTSLSGRALGDYIVKEQIGEGGFGRVYLGVQEKLARDVVIKVLHARGQADPQGAQRFLREAHVASRLDHPYAAHIYAFGIEADGLQWIAMERVRGTTLHELLRGSG